MQTIMGNDKILIEKEREYKGDDGGDRYSVFLDGKKYAEHLKFSELSELFDMMEREGNLE